MTNLHRYVAIETPWHLLMAMRCSDPPAMHQLAMYSAWLLVYLYFFLLSANTSRPIVSSRRTGSIAVLSCPFAFFVRFPTRQFAIIDKIPKGSSRVSFQFVAAIEPTEDFNSKNLKFRSLKVRTTCVCVPLRSGWCGASSRPVWWREIRYLARSVN